MPPYWFIVRIETGHEFATSSDSKPVHTLSNSLRIFLSTLESGFKNILIRCRIRRMRVDGSRIRKEKVADSKISGYVWTGPKSDHIILTQALKVLRSVSLFKFLTTKISQEFKSNAAINDKC